MQPWLLFYFQPAPFCLKWLHHRRQGRNCIRVVGLLRICMGIARELLGNCSGFPMQSSYPSSLCPLGFLPLPLLFPPPCPPLSVAVAVSVRFRCGFGAVSVWSPRNRPQFISDSGLWAIVGCGRIARKLHRNCPEIARKWLGNGSETALKLPQTLIPLRDRSKVALKLP